MTLFKAIVEEIRRVEFFIEAPSLEAAQSIADKQDENFFDGELPDLDIYVRETKYVPTDEDEVCVVDEFADAQWMTGKAWRKSGPPDYSPTEPPQKEQLFTP